MDFPDFYVIPPTPPVSGRRSRPRSLPTPLSSADTSPRGNSTVPFGRSASERSESYTRYFAATRLQPQTSLLLLDRHSLVSLLRIVAEGGSQKLETLLQVWGEGRGNGTWDNFWEVVDQTYSSGTELARYNSGLSLSSDDDPDDFQQVLGDFYQPEATEEQYRAALARMARLAGSSNSAEAQLELGMIMLKGYKLITPDRNRALYWLRKAQNGGSVRAAQLLRGLSSLSVGQNLSPRHVSELEIGPGKNRSPKRMQGASAARLGLHGHSPASSTWSTSILGDLYRPCSPLVPRPADISLFSVLQERDGGSLLDWPHGQSNEYLLPSPAGSPRINLGEYFGPSASDSDDDDSGLRSGQASGFQSARQPETQSKRDGGNGLNKASQAKKKGKKPSSARREHKQKKKKK